MMIVEYRRDLAHNYMLIREEAEEFRDTYEIRILMSNRIPGLLPLETEQINGSTVYRYDITSCQPFHVLCAGGRVTADVLRSLYTNLLDSLISFEDYLLDTRHLLLDPEYLYLRWEEHALQIPYLPFYLKDVRESLISLTEAILMQISNGLEESIVLACRILHELQGKDVQLSDVRRFLEEERQSHLSGTYRSSEEQNITLRKNAVSSQNCAWPEAMSESGTGHHFRAQESYGSSPGSSAGAEETVHPGELSNRGEISFSGDYTRGGEIPFSGENMYTGQKEEPGNPVYAGKQVRSADVKNRGKKNSSERAGQPKTNLMEKDRKETGGDSTMLRTVKGQLPERGTVRMALIAAVPAGLVFVLLHLQEILLLSLEEAAGTAILVAVLLMLAMRLSEKTKQKKAAEEKAEKPVPAWDMETEDPDEELLPDLQGLSELRVDGAIPSGRPEEEGKEEAFQPLYLQNTGNKEDADSDKTVLLTEYRAEASTRGEALIPLQPDSGLPTIPLRGRELLIGKQKALVDVVIEDDAISRIHARIVRRSGVAYISDMGSKNGTKVNGKAVVGRDEVPLTEGAEVSFAACRYIFRGR